MQRKKIYKTVTVKDKNGKTIAEPDKAIVAIIQKERDRRPHPYGGFVTMNTQAMLELSMREDLTPLQMRLFLRLVGEMPIGNEGVVNQSDAAEVMGVTREAISRAMKKLCADGLITKTQRGRAVMIKINPYYAWKGSANELHKEYNDITAKKRRSKFSVVDGGKKTPNYDKETGEIFD